MKGIHIEVQTASGAIGGVVLEWGQGTEAPELVLTPLGVFRRGYKGVYYPV